MDFELFKDGVLIMIIGMGTVYLFLTIMIYIMNLSKGLFEILNKYFPEETEKEKVKPKNNNDDAEIAVAIACAALKRGKSC